MNLGMDLGFLLKNRAILTNMTMILFNNFLLGLVTKAHGGLLASTNVASSESKYVINGD